MKQTRGSQHLVVRLQAAEPSAGSVEPLVAIRSGAQAAAARALADAAASDSSSEGSGGGGGDDGSEGGGGGGHDLEDSPVLAGRPGHDGAGKATRRGAALDEDGEGSEGRGPGAGEDGEEDGRHGPRGARREDPRWDLLLGQWGAPNQGGGAGDRRAAPRRLRHEQHSQVSLLSARVGRG
jgi:hypothetical protein